MAKISAADTLRPLMGAFAKYHFWLLAIVVPSVLLPLLFLARGTLAAKIQTQRGIIDGHIKTMDAIGKITPHPNESWTTDIDKSTMRVKQETLAEWRNFWERQQPLRVWPAMLGDDFVQTVETLKPDGKLSRKLLERYQNNAIMLVRDLPKRMGVADAIADSLAPGQAEGEAEPRRPPVGQKGERGDEATYFFSWNAANQNRIAASFKWAKVPSTTKVLLAQEELWVYGVLCDVVARVNESATGPHNVAIETVNELLVGYPAAEDNPGGQAGGRIRRVVADPAAAGADPSAPGAGPPGAAVGAGSVRPPHPRFAAAQASGPPGTTPPQGASGNVADDQLRNWIYVNFEGKPLDAAGLAAAPDCQMVHLMPFVLRVVIDQRLIDALLVALASTPFPIDVRQVRINVAGSSPSGVQPATESGSAAPPPVGRPHDVDLELRGTVGLATPPDAKAVGLEPGQPVDAATEEPGEKPAAGSEASSRDRLNAGKAAS